jgi:hypothetical protein
VVEEKDVGRWSFRHSWRSLNVALPPKVHPITVLLTFLVALPCISITISVGNSTYSSRLMSTGDGPWGSTPVGVVDPGPLPERIVRARLVGVAKKVLDPLLGAVLSLESLILAAGSSFFASRPSAAAPRISKLVPLPVTTGNNSGMQGRGAEFLGSTWDLEELLGAPTASLAICIRTFQWELGGGDRWRRPSLDSPPLRAVVVNALLPGDRHPFKLLVAARSSNAVSVIFPSLSRLSGRRMLGAAGASLEQCARETKDPLVPNEFSLLTGGKALAPPPGLGWNFPNPKGTLCPAFRIL